MTVFNDFIVQWPMFSLNMKNVVISALHVFTFQAMNQCCSGGNGI